MSDTNKKKYLDELLKKLEEKKIESSPPEMLGRAIGKSESSIYLSIPTGIVEIPISEIESVTPVLGSAEDIVSIFVRDVGKIEYKTRVHPLGPHGAGETGMSQTGSTPTVTYIDSSTVTYGRLDATDDTRPVSKVDDWWV